MPEDQGLTTVEREHSGPEGGHRGIAAGGPRPNDDEDVPNPKECSQWVKLQLGLQGAATRGTRRATGKEVLRDNLEKSPLEGSGHRETSEKSSGRLPPEEEGLTTMKKNYVL